MTKEGENANTLIASKQMAKKCQFNNKWIINDKQQTLNKKQITENEVWITNKRLMANKWGTNGKGIMYK